MTSENAQNPSAAASSSCASELRISGIAEADIEAARGMDQRAGGIDTLRLGDRIGEWHVDDPAVLPGDHAVEAAGRDEIDGMDAKGRGNQPIGRIRLAAALDVAEDGDAGFGAGPASELLAEELADAAERCAATAVSALDLLAERVPDRLGDDDQSAAAAALAYLLDVAGGAVLRVGGLADQDDVGAAGGTRRGRAVGGVAGPPLHGR